MDRTGARSGSLRGGIEALRTVLAAACMLLSACAARAEVPAAAPRFVHFGAAEGLSATVQDMAIDRRGYVWLATGDGLARYDGERFRFWRHEPGLVGGLPENDVTVLHVDAADRLWAATWYALTVFDPARRAPRRIVFGRTVAACAVEITTMSSDAAGRLWLATHAGEICAIAVDGRVSRLPRPAGGWFAGGRPIALHARGDGDLLVGTDDGLWRLRARVAAPRAMRLHADAIGGAAVFALTPRASGGVWVGADEALHVLDAQDALRPLPWPLPRLRRAVVARSVGGDHWIGDYTGLYRRGAGDPRPTADSGLGFGDGVLRIATDPEGNLWVATYTQGLFLLPADHARFRLIAPPAMHPSGWTTPAGAPLSADLDRVGDVWALSADAVGRVRWRDGRYAKVATTAALGLEEPRALRACRDGRIVIADARGVVAFEPATARASRLYALGDGDGVHLPETLDCDREGRIWVSLYGGGLTWLARDGQVLRAFSAVDTLGAEAEAYIDLRFAPDGAPWYSDGHALRRWDGSGFRTMPLAEGGYVYALDFASADTLWVTRFGALERYRFDGTALRLLERIGADEGLPVVETRSVRASAGGQVWLNSVRGLIHYDPQARRARMFGLRDGLSALDTTLDQLADGPAGRGVTITGRDLILFDPDRPLPPPRISPLAIETLELRRGEDTVPIVGDAVTMQPGDRDLRVVARVLSLADPAAHRYRFRLLGYDPDWVLQGERGERGERVFSSLPPGHYALLIQGANVDGLWSSTRRIALTVEAPWWQRWWAVLLYACAASVLILWLAHLDRVRLKRRYNYQLIRQKRELAEQASASKSRFLANLGHEIRTPMTGVLGMSELLLSSPLDEHRRRQVGAIRRAGEHLLRLVDDALDLARIEAGRLTLDEAVFALDAVVEDVVALMCPLAERKGLRFVCEVGPEVRGGWRGDVTRVRQILLNLLGNAIKFTAHGEVALRIEGLSPHGLRCTVSDTGPGLDIEQQRRLFQRFEQADGARTASRYGGSGLGLAISRELAVAMGGGIELISAPGEGACFIVRLPLARAVLPAAETAASSASHLRTRGEREILLVEDDAIVADVLAGLLQAQGHRVVHAGHALAAVTAHAARRFDLGLLDLDLPGMDGLALARLLRTQGFDRPLIAITARADAEAEPEALAAGFDAFLRKPLTGEMLAAAIAQRLESVS
jgi:signal transduction histidine kinase/ligand-binding sensor domain-containing protein/ActR/RegA family two-component response regulator